MVSRENRVIVACIASALVLLYLATELATLPTWGSAAIVLGVGVVVPTLVNTYLDSRPTEGGSR